MIDPKKIEQIARQVHESMPKGIREFGEDVEKKIRQTLQAQLTRLDLVSRAWVWGGRIQGRALRVHLELHAALGHKRGGDTQFDAEALVQRDDGRAALGTG